MSTLGRGLLGLLRAGMIFYLVFCVALAVLTTVPMALGWRPLVVTSGSMSPVLGVGDVVLADRETASALKIGNVVVVHDPAQPGRLLSHRVIARLADGSLITKGDANRLADSTPVPPQGVLGAVRGVVPLAGLVQLWWSRNRPAFLGWLLSVVVAGYLAPGPRHQGRRNRRRAGRRAAVAGSFP